MDNEETIFDQSRINQNPKAEQQSMDETQKENMMGEQENKDSSPASSKTKRKIGSMAAAGIGAAVGVAGTLIPKMVFPVNPEDGEELSDEEGGLEGQEETDAPTASEHLTGHDMDVATSVDDSMSFSEAFAAARHEVGPGGLFVWHGHTYGTYYANEWNAMTPEEHDQYWSDVYHTTSHLDPEEPEEPVATTDPEEPVGPEEPIATTDPEEPVEPEEPVGPTDPEEPIATTDPDEPVEPEEPVGLTDPEEPIATTDPDEPVDPEEPVIDVPETLVVNEEDVIAELDLDDDGVSDVAMVDVNDNDIPDLVVDTTGDGQYDTLIVDPLVDTEGNLVVAEENIHEIDDMVVLSEDEPVDGGEGLVIDDGTGGGAIDDPTFDNPEGDVFDTTDDGLSTENPDVDLLADVDFDPDVTIDNNMNMDEFV